ncbi:hypothetical protein KY284_001165 [Solanum tuberosum]|nr:hypothetical protein KY284_001165 [Solanum tuberosum]
MVAIQYDYVPKYCVECKMQGQNKENCKVVNFRNNVEQNAQHIQDIAQLKHELQAAKIEKLQKGGARILSSRKVVGDPGNWNVVRDRRGKTNTAPQITSVVENKFEALAQEENTLEGISTLKTDNIEINIISNKGKPTQYKGKEGVIISTKEWITKAFRSVLQGDAQRSSTNTINNFVESDDNESALKSKEHALEKSNQLEVCQSNKVRNNGDKQKPQNIDDGRKNMDINKCHEKHRKQQGEKMKGMQSVNLATTSTYLNVNSPEKHEELHTTEDKHNKDMYAVVISRDSIDKGYKSLEKHDMVHMINEQHKEFSKSIISANTIVQCHSSSSMGTTSEINVLRGIIIWKYW